MKAQASPIVKGRLYLVNGCIKIEAENASHACAKLILATIFNRQNRVKKAYSA